MVAGAKVSGFEDLQAAVAAATDHSLLWACPGVHAVDSPLVVHGREDLTIAGAGALLIAIEQSRLLDLEDSKQLTVRGLRFTQLHCEEPTLTAEVGGDLTRAALDNGNTFIPRAAEARAPALAAAALPNLKAAFPEKRSWPIIAMRPSTSRSIRRRIPAAMTTIAWPVPTRSPSPARCRPVSLRRPSRACRRSPSPAPAR